MTDYPTSNLSSDNISQTLNNLQNSVMGSSLWNDLGTPINTISNNTSSNSIIVKSRDFVYSTVFDNQTVTISEAYIDDFIHIHISPKVLKSVNSISLNLNYSGADYSNVLVMSGGSLSSTVSSSSINGSGLLNLSATASGGIELTFSAKESNVNFLTKYSSLVVNGLVVNSNELQISTLLEKQLTNYPVTGELAVIGKSIQNEILSVENNISDKDGIQKVSYQWLSDGTSILGATQEVYRVIQSDVGKKISVKMIYTDDLGRQESITSLATTEIKNVNDAPTGTVTITGTAIQKQILTASNTLADSDGLGVISYTWLSDGTPIPDATQSTDTLTQTDLNKKISVKASYTDALGTAENISSSTTALVENVNDTPTGIVSITGTAIKDQVLTASNTLADVDGLGIIGYTWLKNGTVIPNAIQSTYKLTQADTGQNISVRASYIDLQDTAESVVSSSVFVAPNSVPTGTATIKGVSTWGTTLSITSTIKDADGLGALNYTWQNDSGELSVSSKYTLQQSDVGKKVWTLVSYTDKKGNFETVKSNVIDVTVSTKPSALNDILTGSDAADKLSGLAGNDTLIGGLGKDKLTGGVGEDVFKFTSISDSSPLSKQADTITDFKHTQGDKIDLSAIDINSTLDGRQSFIPINAQTFSADATGQLRFDAKTSTLYGSTNSDSAPEFAIVLSGVKSLLAEDFIL